MATEVKRFKAEDGREGSYAPIGNGLIKVLYDDGNMVIVRGTETESDGSPDSTDEKPNDA